MDLTLFAFHAKITKKIDKTNTISRIFIRKYPLVYKKTSFMFFLTM